MGFYPGWPGRPFPTDISIRPQTQLCLRWAWIALLHAPVVLSNSSNSIYSDRKQDFFSAMIPLCTVLRSEHTLCQPLQSLVTSLAISPPYLESSVLVVWKTSMQCAILFFASSLNWLLFNVESLLTNVVNRYSAYSRRFMKQFCHLLNIGNR